MTEMSAADRLKKLKYHGQYGEMIRIADEQIARLRALWCEEKSKAMTFHAEVERLRAEVAALKAKRDEADAECREANASWCREIEESIDLNRELAFMREQRDEARRWVCELWEKYQPATSNMTARDYAAEGGWDCFREEVQP